LHCEYEVFDIGLKITMSDSDNQLLQVPFIGAISEMLHQFQKSRLALRPNPVVTELTKTSGRLSSHAQDHSFSQSGTVLFLS